MYELITNRGDIKSELNELVRCFSTCENTEVNFTHVKSDCIKLYVKIGKKNYSFEYADVKHGDKYDRARYDLYTCKTALYKALSDYSNIKLPWGSLTGIRPTRVAMRILSEGTARHEISRKMQSDYFVSPLKADLTAEILFNQSKSVGDRMSVATPPETKDNLVNLYVHIPFCPSRCAYCSFVSQGIEKKTWQLLPYADALIKEIHMTKRIIAEQSKRIFSVYIGGGTPTVLSVELLGAVLNAAFAENAEFTCEAGRPDTITDEKLGIMNACGVNRISINPQTLHNRTLIKIGRNHTTEQFFEAYGAARKYGFVKNVDLIAGLSGETERDFMYTLNRVLELSPENITVHTLCVKRGANDAMSEREENLCAEKMVDYSVSALKKCGYEPYYLYRQKQMAANLENIGWCKPNMLCVNNVTVMEEMLPVYACGAGAISKLLGANGKIVRLANPKDVLLYLKEFDERMAKKEAFYKTNT